MSSFLLSCHAPPPREWNFEFPSIPTSSPVSKEEGPLIQEIRQEDNETLNKLGFDLRDLAEHIEAVIKSPGLFEQQFNLKYKDSKEALFTAQCLFCKKTEENSVHYEITNRQTGRSLTVSKIALHYMRHHDFYGFPGIDPRVMKDVLHPPKRSLLSRIIHFFAPMSKKNN